MRGTKAKRLRKLVYGDLSLKSPRLYQGIRGHGWMIAFNDPKGPRAHYQAAKKYLRRERLMGGK